MSYLSSLVSKLTADELDLAHASFCQHRAPHCKPTPGPNRQFKAAFVARISDPGATQSGFTIQAPFARAVALRRKRLGLRSTEWPHLNSLLFIHEPLKCDINIIKKIEVHPDLLVGDFTARCPNHAIGCCVSVENVVLGESDLTAKLACGCGLQLAARLASRQLSKHPKILILTSCMILRKT